MDLPLTGAVVTLTPVVLPVVISLPEVPIVVTIELIKNLNQKRDEYLHLLDKQLSNYRHTYAFFEKQLRKAYPKADDYGLYPSRDELITKQSKLQNATQLAAFVKSIKDDINEAKILSADLDWLTTEEVRLVTIKNLVKNLTEVRNKLVLGIA